ncbi:CG16716 [Drosophila busckii]|uniref:CG16716 n=1 Tax=Drosophila busckii TaxID=30019 RepID=A0A0M4EIR6_DROBS|nr:tubulin polyglutamylase ttll6 [Drosophila busckii]ALC42735.1 CG16716 [Drosophila busckii]
MTNKINSKSKKGSNRYSLYFNLQKQLPKEKKFSTHELQDQESVYVVNRRKRLRAATKQPELPKWRRVEKNFVAEQQDNAGMLDNSETYAPAHFYREPNISLDELQTPPAARGIRLSICVEHTRFPLVAKISKSMGLQHVPEHRLWNLQWCDSTPHLDLLKAMKRFQQINHFPGINEICRKDLLSRNLNRMLKLYPGDFRIFPKTWLMPTDAYDVAVYASKHKRTYILKPYSSGQGRGIWLTNNLRTVARRGKQICQTYVERPLLIDGYKFDLRVYTLITSVDPLRIFVYNEGLARFATQKYMPPDLNNNNNVYMHLTNYCLNRRNSKYDMGNGDEGGSKRKLSAFNKWLKDHNYSVEDFWAAVDDAIIKTVISAWPVLKHNYCSCFPKHDKIQACFQLLGFDILVDWKLKPYILEVNQTPSLCTDQPVDHEVKRPLIRDTLNLLSTPLVDKEEIIREDRVALRDRLLRQAHRRRVEAKDANNKDLYSACSLSALSQQIAWEESHLGNYRRVMPPTDHDKVNYYCKFYDQDKQTPMFRETASSRSRLRLNREQMRLRNLKQNKEDDLKQRSSSKSKEIIGQVFSANSKIARRQMRKQRQLAAKEAEEKKQQKQLTPPTVRETKTKAEASAKDSVVSTASGSKSDEQVHTKTKQTLSLQKAKRQKSRRQLQRRTRQARRLERESRKDAEFLNNHSIKRAACERLPGGSSKQLLSAPAKKCNSNNSGNKKKPRTKTQLKLRQVEQQAESSSSGGNKQRRANAVINKECVKKIALAMSENWQPMPICEAEEQGEVQWRQERSATLNNWKIQELLFTEMYEQGHLTKNDIKQFPKLLYRILWGNMAGNYTSME